MYSKCVFTFIIWFCVKWSEKKHAAMQLNTAHSPRKPRLLHVSWSSLNSQRPSGYFTRILHLTAPLWTLLTSNYQIFNSHCSDEVTRQFSHGGVTAGYWYIVATGAAMTTTAVCLHTEIRVQHTIPAKAANVTKKKDVMDFSCQTCVRLFPL